MKTHARPAEAAAVLVTANATAASPLAPSALPGLNPNHPNQSNAAPMTVIVTLWGGRVFSGYPRRRPITIAATSADTPELMWTTVPPAKSSAPFRIGQPPPQTQWASGSYTIVAQSRLKMMNAGNRIRSANAPVIKATVMAANMP
jgi:hypothetical protein